MRKMLSKIEEVDGGIKIAGDMYINGNVSAKNIGGEAEYEQTFTPSVLAPVYHFSVPTNSKITVSVTGSTMKIRLYFISVPNANQGTSGSPCYTIDNYAISIPHIY